VLSDRNVAKIIDFGWARFGPAHGPFSFGGANPQGYLQVVPPGTPGYLAPEIYSQEPHDHRCDFYTFGVLIWMVLTGGMRPGRIYVDEPIPPFNGRDPREDWTLLNKALEDPGDDAWPVPKNARALVSSLIDRDPQRRPDPISICQDLFLQVEAVPSEGAFAEMKEWLRRLAPEEGLHGACERFDGSAALVQTAGG